MWDRKLIKQVYCHSQIQVWGSKVGGEGGKVGVGVRVKIVFFMVSSTNHMRENM